MPTLPTSLALTVINDNAPIVASDHRNNYSAIQTDVNALIAALSGGTAGDVLGGVGTTLTFAKPPGYEYAYNEFTTGVTVSAVSEATANTIVTASAVTFDGATPVVVEFFTPDFDSPASANVVLTFVLYDGAAAIGVLAKYQDATAAALNCGPLVLQRRLTPSAAAHTYSVRAYVNSNSYTVQGAAGGAGALMPGYIRITRV